MLGEDDPTAPTPKLPPVPEDTPAPGTVQHALQHCRTLRDNLNAIATEIASVREEIDRSLREAPSIAALSIEVEVDVDIDPTP